MVSVDAFSRVLIQYPDDGSPDSTRYGFVSTEGERIFISADLRHQPDGLRSAAVKAAIKYEDVYDTSLIVMRAPGPAAGIFTRNRNASPAVDIDRLRLKQGKAQALAVISKNANVFTPTDHDDAEAVCALVAREIGVSSSQVLLSCTGVIGVPLPMPRVEAGIKACARELKPGLLAEVAQAILTTDRGPKVCSLRHKELRIAGMAKGAGMIEPDMATMLVYFFTNLELPAHELQEIIARLGDRTFNSISVDTDTSTSDSLIILSTGSLPATDELARDFEAGLAAMMLKLSRDIVFQAEGATKLVEAKVLGAKNARQARQVAKLIVNSPLIKTAIFGADPNWGRIVMAIGKPAQDESGPLDPKKVTIKMEGQALYSRGRSVALDLDGLSARMKSRKKIDIEVDLGEGAAAWTAWGCDLSYDYVKTNADYTS